MNTVRIGILGFAHGHVDMYCTRWGQQPELGAKVVAGWDHDAARLATNAKSYGFTPCATPEELLARKDVQAVVVASETSLQADLVEKAAAAGKSIVVQKPMALTMAQADRMVLEKYDLLTKLAGLPACSAVAAASAQPAANA